MSLQSAASDLLAKGQLSVSEPAAERLCGFGRGTFRRYRREGTGPLYSRPIRGGRIVYQVADLVRWLESRKFASRAEEVARG